MPYIAIHTSHSVPFALPCAFPKITMQFREAR